MGKQPKQVSRLLQHIWSKKYENSLLACSSNTGLFLQAGKKIKKQKQKL